MKRLFPIIALAVALPMSASVPRMCVYRSDGMFNIVELQDGTELRHTATASRQAVVLPDGEEVELASIDSCTLRKTDIPVLRIHLDDYPDAPQLWDKDLYLSATIETDGNGSADDSPATTVNVKGRGNSTWSMPKKPVRLKFPKKISLLGMKKAKSYVLLANFIDPSLMRNAVALRLARELGLPYTNDFRPCYLEFNGNMLGAFLLTHKIGINGASVDIEENDGVLLELSTEFDEDYRFRSAVYNLPVMIKDPDFAELGQDIPDGPSAQERLGLWQNDFNQAERAAGGEDAFEYFDLNSFVDFILVNNICGNHEIGWPKSVYLHKTNAGPENKYIFGPVWDFDAAFNLSDAKGTAEKSPEAKLWLNSLFAKLAERPEFKQAYRGRFEYFRQDIYPRLKDFIRGYASETEPSAKLNGTLWPEQPVWEWTYALSSFDTVRHRKALLEWLDKRISFMQKQIDKDSY